MKKKYILLLFMFNISLVIPAGLSYGAETAETDDLTPDEKEGYIGAATCKGCHEIMYESYIKSTHSKKEVQGPEFKEACETCHGPGAKHVEKGGGRGVNIIDFGKKVDPQVRSEKCLSCHEDMRREAFWNMSGHKNGDVACNDCHIAHSRKEKLLPTAEPDLCFRCHKDVRAQSHKQSHHPMSYLTTQGAKISCSDCHEVHGEFGPKMIKADSVNELCYSCHAEKRGPFMWEHPPVEENCLTCHTPHGSNHGKLLNRRPPELCQSCHDWSQHPGQPYTQFETFPSQQALGKNRLIARSCMNCHSQIHGSNGPSTRGHRFVR